MWTATVCSECRYGSGKARGDSGYISTTSSGDEITYLYQDINRIDNMIRQLHEKKAAHCRRLNEMQSPATALPSSILSAIFAFVCPPSEYNSSHQRVRRTNKKSLVLPIFALCAVSSSWRQAALSTPQLWAKLDWGWKYHLPAEDAASLLRTYFTRTGALPLDLKLNIDEKWEIENSIHYNHSGEIDRHLDALRGTIFLENGGKIGSLKLDAPLRWLHLVSRSFTQLSDLSLRSVRIDDCVDLKSLPSLTRVTFINMKVTPILPWKQIRVVNLVCAHINVSLDLLTRCPNLIEFHSQHPNPVRNESISLHLQDTVTLQHLQWLDWSCISSLWDDALFRFVHLPSLHRLSLTGDAPWSHERDHTLTRFLRRLPTSIELELGYVRESKGGTLPVLQMIFAALPQLKKLSLLEDDHAFLEKAISLLTSSSPSPGSPLNHTIYLPVLQSLSLRSGDRDKTKDGVFTRFRGVLQDLPGMVQGDLFVDMIKQRKQVLHLSAFRLELNFCPSWQSQGRDDLRALVSQGLDLEIYEKMKRVDWLRG